MGELLKSGEYKNWLIELKSKIQQSQIKAALAVNSQLIQLYWDLGKQIAEKQETAKWGSGFIDQLSQDLKEEFPNIGGFSKQNLYRIRNFYLYYFQHFTNVAQVARQLEIPNQQQLVADLEDTKSEQPVRENQTLLLQIHVVILQKIKNYAEAIFYVKETIENNWSRVILEMQIESNLYGRQGKAITNLCTLNYPKMSAKHCRRLNN